MKKIKYFYNTNTLRYEKFITPLRVKLLRTLGLIAAVLVAGFAFTQISNYYFPTTGEKKLQQENKQIQYDYAFLQEELDQLKIQMKEIEDRDNEIYRTIFEANPIPDSARQKLIDKKKEATLVAKLTNEELNESIIKQISLLRARFQTQKNSFNTIETLIKNKEALLAATPAIQPVSNRELSRIASGFGTRIDPVYKTTKFHAGLDFAAPQGTPIYATANGVVSFAGNAGNGYGNHVIINHGFNYETLYGHMVRVKAQTGQRVTRGEVIGWVGSTGKSTGPHLHYEVHKSGQKLDPIYFFYNDLTPEQFDRILKIASAGNQTFD
jgi:murein DD-endopeptidase MepM/ murein hydrolase activator NlpD